ncbi:YfhO family protein [Oleiharenicola lentus]|uniref:YfhO family protein n=1 Tax=Oleiharenicola lentus TaxID=2508720 RepID=UPI003F67617C
MMIKTWLDFRVICLSALLALAAALPVMTTSVDRRDYYLFDITLTSSSVGTTQLFWDLGRGYNENDSSRQPLRIEPAPVVYRYMMPMGEFKGLRFDPIDGVGTFNFSHAQIVDRKGRVKYKFAPSDFRARAEIASLETRGDTLQVQTTPQSRDPVMEIELKAPIRLTSDSRIWFELGWPIFLPVFLTGLLLGTPFVARALTKLITPLGAWLRARPVSAIALTAVVAVVIQCHPIIFQGRSFASPSNGGLMLYGSLPTLPGSEDYMYTNTMSSDTGALLFQHLYYPVAQREALSQGELPLWNRWSLCGEPLLGQGQSMFGDPLNFITILADGAAWAWDLRFLIVRWIFAAALGGIVWQLTRHLAASLLITATAAFIGFYTFRLVHPANFSVCVAPLILWAWTGLVHAGTSRRIAGWLAALVAANWFVMTSGTMKEAYMLMAGLNFAGVLLLFLLPITAGRRLRTLGLAALAGFGFVLLAAPGWMSFLVAWKHSMTGYDKPGAVPLPLSQVIGFFDDIFYRQTVVDEIIVAPAHNFFLLLGVLWWLVAPRLWRSDRAGLALLLAALPPFAFAFGLVPESIVVKIPFVANIIHTGNTFSCILLVIVTVLAGCGLRDALERLRTDGWGRHLGATFLLLAGLVGVYFVATRTGVKSPFFAGYAAALLLAVIALPVAARASFRLARPGLLWVAMVLGLPLLLWRHCQIGDTLFNFYAFVPALRADIHASSPGIEFVNEQRREPIRVAPWGHALYPSYNTTLRWEGLYGVDALRSREYQEFAVEFGMQRVWNWNWRNDPDAAPVIVPAHDVLNAALYVADRSDPPREYAGLTLLKQLDLDVYASPTAWPRAFFTDRLGTYDTPRDFAQQVLTGDRKPFASVQTSQSDTPDLPQEFAGRTVRAAKDYRLTANTTTFTVETTGPGVAVLTETYYAEDFQVTVNGKPAPYFRVNHAFKGVAIDSAGRHEITFAYWPQHFTAALWLCAAGAVILLIGFICVWRSAPTGGNLQPVT